MAPNSFLPRLRGRWSEGPEGGWISAVVASLLLLLAPSALAQDSTADDAQPLLESWLGFEIPEPYRFVAPGDVPLYMPCEMTEGATCTEGEGGRWAISGYVNAPGGRSDFPLVEMLIEAGWQPVRPAPGQPTSQFYWVNDAETCTRLFTLDSRWRDGQGVTLHIYPCETTE